MMGFGMMGGMLVFWVIIIVLAVLLVKGLFNSNSNRSRDNDRTATQILDERYARGEITQEQYQMMVKDIH
jgi:putative membrane protein